MEEFISPQELYSEVKEALRSYFDAGIIDDMMFSKWTHNCLRKFYKLAYPIKETHISIRDYEGVLPDDFKYVREAWICADVHRFNYFNHVTRKHISCKPIPPSICEFTCGTDCKEVFAIEFTLDGNISYELNNTLEPLRGATLDTVFLESSKLNIGTDVILYTGTIKVPNNTSGQRLFIFYKK